MARRAAVGLHYPREQESGGGGGDGRNPGAPKSELGPARAGEPKTGRAGVTLSSYHPLSPPLRAAQ
eukprot:1064175-Prorocentrum_minimum.AAC.2